MIRQVLVTIAAAVLLPALLTASAASAATPSSTLAGGQIAVEGHLTGPPTPGGVRGALHAMPPQPFMDKLRVGEHVQGRLVGVATSSPTGVYAIKVSHPGAIRSSVFDGVVNFEVWADWHGYCTVYGLVRHVAAGGALYGPAPNAPIRATLTMSRLGKHDGAEPESALISGCWVLASDLGKKLARVEGLWSTINNVNKFLSYSVGSGSSVSIGVSVNGGPWGSGSSGSTSVTDTVGGEDYGPLADKDSRIGETDMDEGFFDTCQISTEYATFPYHVDGGTAWLDSNPPAARFCVPQTVAAFACGTHSYPLAPGDTARGVVADDSNNGNG